MPKLASVNRKQYGLTALDESMLTALYMLTIYTFGVKEGRGVIWVKGRAISELIGGKWDTHRHRAMRRLDAEGLVRCYKMTDSWLYALTDMGVKNRQQAIALAHLNAGIMAQHLGNDDENN